MIKLIFLSAKKRVKDITYVWREKVLMIRDNEIKEIDWSLFNDLKKLWAEELDMDTLKHYSDVYQQLLKTQKSLENGVKYDAKKRLNYENSLS